MAERRVRPSLAAWLKLEGELGQWRRLGVTPRLWWRDDDARIPSAALDRLLAVAGKRPLALAVIPDGDLTALAARLAGKGNVRIGQHGMDHINRRPAGEAPSEYVRQPTLTELIDRIAEGRSRLNAVGLQACFFTPPWNAIDPVLPAALAAIGALTLSAGRIGVQRSDLTYLSAEIDVLRWKGGARFKGGWRIMSMLAQALAERRRSGAFQQPVGLLTHHLDHDDATWRYLARALPYLDQRFEWVSVDAPRYGEVRLARPAGRDIDAMAEVRHV